MHVLAGVERVARVALKSSSHSWNGSRVSVLKLNQSTPNLLLSVPMVLLSRLILRARPAIIC